MKRKAIAMLMVASMTVALFAGCGSKSDESDSGKVKLNYICLFDYLFISP